MSGMVTLGGEDGKAQPSVEDPVGNRLLLSRGCFWCLRGVSARVNVYARDRSDSSRMYQ